MLVHCESCGHSGKCPDTYAGKSVRCPKCKKSIYVHFESFVSSEEEVERPGSLIRRRVPFLQIIGAILFLGGVYFGISYFNMDPTIEHNGHRIYNIGLVSQRQNGLMLSIAGSVIGLILVAIGQRTGNNS